MRIFIKYVQYRKRLPTRRSYIILQIYYLCTDIIPDDDKKIRKIRGIQLNDEKPTILLRSWTTPPFSWMARSSQSLTSGLQINGDKNKINMDRENEIFQGEKQILHHH